MLSHLFSGFVSEVDVEREQHDGRVAPGRGLLRLPERPLKLCNRGLPVLPPLRHLKAVVPLFLERSEAGFFK